MSISRPSITRFHAMLIALCLSVGAMAAFVVNSRSALPDFDPETGYRIAHLRGHVPNTLDGGSVVDLDAVESLIEREKAILIDAFFFDPSWKQSLSLGMVSDDRKRFSIPGAIWMPWIGRGRLSASQEAEQARQLTALTGGDRDKPLVFFCMSECWTSWNAARRAVQLGYRRVHWFPGGTDLWRDGGNPLSEATHHAG